MFLLLSNYNVVNSQLAARWKILRKKGGRGLLVGPETNLGPLYLAYC